MLGFTLNKLAMCLPFSVFTPPVLFSPFTPTVLVRTWAESNVLTVRNKHFALLYTRGGVSGEKTNQGKNLYKTGLLTWVFQFVLLLGICPQPTFHAEKLLLLYRNERKTRFCALWGEQIWLQRFVVRFAAVHSADRLHSYLCNPIKTKAALNKVGQPYRHCGLNVGADRHVLFWAINILECKVGSDTFLKEFCTPIHSLSQVNLGLRPLPDF